MNWVIEYLPEARKDMQGLDHSVQTQVLKGIRKVAGNPVSVHEGGYGKPLGNKNGNDLTGLFKIKFQNLGLTRGLSAHHQRYGHEDHRGFRPHG